MDKIRLGIIGVGSMGAPVSQLIIVEKQCPEIEVTAICDNSEERRQWAAKTYEGMDIAIFAEAEELMKSGLVDAVYIAVPHYDHPTLAIKAFGYGLHVMLEKPAGVYTKAVREMNEAAEKAGVKFGMMFQSRTHPIHRKTKELLESGRFGRIRGVTFIVNNWYRSQQYYDSGSWRATWAGEGGGVLLNQCPHNLDVLQWLCGMPVEISAACSVAQWHDIEVEDDVVATLRYANGALGTFVASTGICPGSNRLEIATDKGTLVLENNELTVREIDKPLQEYADQTSNVPKERITTATYRFFNEKTSGHPIVLNAFANAILHGGELIANGYEGINSLTLSNAMYLSDWTGKKITLPLDEDLFLEELNKRRATSKHKEVVASYGDASWLFQKR